MTPLILSAFWLNVFCLAVLLSVWLSPAVPLSLSYNRLSGCSPASVIHLPVWLYPGICPTTACLAVPLTCPTPACLAVALRLSYKRLAGGSPLFPTPAYLAVAVRSYPYLSGCSCLCHTTACLAVPLFPRPTPVSLAYPCIYATQCLSDCSCLCPTTACLAVSPYLSYT